jgi:hypothetical protein
MPFETQKIDIKGSFNASSSLKLTLPAAYVKGLSTNSLAVLIGVAVKITFPK